MTAQLDAVRAEKANRTPAQRKMDSQLIFADRERHSGKAFAAADHLHSDLKLAADGRVLLDISGDITPAFLKEIVRLGGEIVNAHPEYQAVRAWLPLLNVEALAGRAEIRFIQPAVKAVINAAPTVGEGVRTHRADYVFNNINIAGGSTKADGTGIKVGVISDSSDFLSTVEGTGDLPNNVTVLPGQSGSPASGEGTAMMEIVHEVAPGAQLYFACGFSGQAQMAANIRALKAQGCSIIIDDVTYSDESPFQASSPTVLAGVIADAVAEVCDQGVLYFSSAANAGNKTDGTSSTWEGDFSALGSLPSVVGPTNDWGGSNYNKVTAASSKDAAHLFWSDPLGNATNDYDLYSVDNAGNILRVSNNTANPYETLGSINVGDNIVVVKASGNSRFLHLDVGRGRLQYSTPGSTRGHNASDAANAFCVAATSVSNSPSPAIFTGDDTNPVETFSSDGPRHLFYDGNGAAITPGDVSSTGGKIVNKPDITAADNVKNSGAYAASSKLNPFSGTSAAAPHAGAIAALIKSYNPALTPAEIRRLMESTALRTMADGRDRDSGIGIVMADRAVGAALPSVITLTPTAHTFDVALGQTGTGQSFPLKIENSGPNPLDWTFDGNAGFLNPQQVSGTVVSGSSQTVDVGLFASAVSNRPAGTYTGYLSVYDSQGGTSRSVFVTLRVNADASAPVVTVTAPPHQSTIAGFATVRGTASGGTGIAGNVVNFDLYHAGSDSYWTGSGWSSTPVLLGAPLDTTTGVWTWNGALPSAANGTLRTGLYGISASTIDNDGSNSQPQSGINNILFTVDNSPPTVSISTPADQSVISSSIYGFSGIANDDLGVNHVTLFLRRNSDNTYWDGSGWVTDPLRANLSSNYTSSDHSWVCNKFLPVPGSSMPNGSYTFEALASDNAGNSSILAISDVTVEIIYHWTGATLHDNNPNNDSHDWATAENWSPDGVPGVLDIVQMDNGDTINLGTDRTVLGLRLGGNHIFTNHTITVTGGPGTSVWYGGTISSNLVIAASAAMMIDTTGIPYLNSGTITNAGTITITNSNPNNPQYLNGHNSTLVNQFGGRIEIARDGVVLHNNATTPVIKNEPGSVFVKTTAAGGQSTINWAMDNDGTVGSDSGTLTFNNGSSPAGSAGTFNASTATARVEFAGGTHVFNTGARFTGPGRGKLSSGTMSMAGAVTIGTAGQAAGGFEHAGYGYVVGGGSLSMIGGGGTWIWSGGEIRTALNLGAGTVSTIDTAGIPYLNSGTITNAGTITITTSNPNNPQYLNGNNSTLINQSGGRIEIARDGLVMHDNDATPVIKNQVGSVFVKTTAAGGQGTISWKMGNDGTVGSDSGTLTFNTGSSPAGGAGTFNASTATARVEFAGGTHIFNTGARFTGPGRGKLSSGTMSMAGAVTIGTAGQAAGGFEHTGYGYVVGAGSLSMIGGGGSFIWSAGEISTALNLGAGTVSIFDTIGTPYLKNGTITNAGTITITNSDPNTSRYMNGYNSTLINQSGGRIEIASDGLVLHDYGATPVIKNLAGSVFVKTVAASGRSIINWVMDNDGTVGSDNGTLAFNVGSTLAGGAGTFNASTATARVEFAGGTHTLNTGARFTGPGRGQLTSGNLILTGAVTVGTSGQAAGGFEQTAGTLSGAGSLSLIGGGGTYAWGGGQISTALVLGSGTISTVDATHAPTLSSGSIDNSGTLTITSPASNTFLNGNDSNIYNELSGRIELSGDGQMFRNIGTQPTLTNYGVIAKTAGAGTTDFGSFALIERGTISLLPNTVLRFGDAVTFDFPSQIVGGKVLFDSTPLTMKAPLAIAAGSVLELTAGGMNGAVDANGNALTTIDGPGTFSWKAGVISGKLNIGSLLSWVINNAAGTPKFNGAAINHYGTAAVVGGGLLDGTSSSLNIKPGAVFQVEATTNFRNINVAPTIVNEGTFRIGDPAAVVTSSWNFSQMPSGKLDFEIGGTNPATPQFSRFLVNATALLGGTLSVTPANGFVPAEGNSFPIMTFNNRNGTDFASTAGLNIATGVKLTETLTATSLTLNATLTNYGDWAKNNFGTNLNNPLIAGPDADPDHDGIVNALEYAFNLDPLTSGQAGLPIVGSLDDPITHKEHLSISYLRRIGVTDDTYTVRVSTSLVGAWDDTGSQLEQVGTPVATGGGVTELVTVRIATPMDSAPGQFVDVMVNVQ